MLARRKRDLYPATGTFSPLTDHAGLDFEEDVRQIPEPNHWMLLTLLLLYLLERRRRLLRRGGGRSFG